MSQRTGNLLCVANYAANTGYAWDSIEGLFARTADHLSTHGISTFVAYPEISVPPRPLAGSAAHPVVLDASLRTRRSLRVTGDFIRQRDIRVVYFGDAGVWRWPYVRLRLAGVRHIVVHVRTYSEGQRPRGLKRVAKWCIVRIPGIRADVSIAVSRFVAGRLAELNLLPRESFLTIWNATSLPAPSHRSTKWVHAKFGLEPERPLVVCACRASPEKGVPFLLRAFDKLVQSSCLRGARPVLLYLGDGPQRDHLEKLRASLDAKADILLAGYLPDAKEVMAGADLCVVPSLREAFGLAALEAMAQGKPVIATRVGGLQELIEHQIQGLLVPPADEAALSDAMCSLLADPAARKRMGDAGRRRVAERFTLERQAACVTAVIERCLGHACSSTFNSNSGEIAGRPTKDSMSIG